jgi:hypothetical protein
MTHGNGRTASFGHQWGSSMATYGEKTMATHNLTGPRDMDASSTGRKGATPSCHVRYQRPVWTGACTCVGRPVARGVVWTR